MDFEYKYKKYKIKYFKNSQLGGKIKKNSRKNKKIVNNIIPNYTEHVSEPWYTLILLGLKTIEGKKNKGRFKDMKIGEIIKWHNEDFNETRSFFTKIIRKTEYDTFKEMLETEGINKCLPGFKDIDSGLNVYYKYNTKEEENEFKVLAIELKILK